MNRFEFGNRLAKLRAVKGVSARQMSEKIGKSENYINKIENNKSFPSMQVFFDICEYLSISPIDFFDEGNSYPEQLNELVSDYKRLDDKSRDHLSGLARGLTRSFGGKD